MYGGSNLAMCDDGRRCFADVNIGDSWSGLGFGWLDVGLTAVECDLRFYEEFVGSGKELGWDVGCFWCDCVGKKGFNLIVLLRFPRDPIYILAL
jgi:hypothetical protein